MKKITSLLLTLTILLSLLSGIAISAEAEKMILLQGWYFNDPTTALQGWTNLDSDGDGHSWYTKATEEGFAPYEGNGAVTSASYDNNLGKLAPDNWLYTPAVSLPNAKKITLSFHVCAMDKEYPKEHYGVYVSPEPVADTATATQLFEADVVASRVQGQWLSETVDLSAYAGKTVYLAFRHFNVTDEFRILLDDVQIFTSQMIVTYQPGADGTGESVIDAQEADTVLTLRGALFTRVGYIQTGWATEDGGAKIYNFGDTCNATATITLYPSWEKCQHVTPTAAGYTHISLTNTHTYVCAACGETVTEACSFNEANVCDKCGYLKGSDPLPVCTIYAACLYGNTDYGKWISFQPNSLKTVNVIGNVYNSGDPSNSGEFYNGKIYGFQTTTGNFWSATFDGKTIGNYEVIKEHAATGSNHEMSFNYADGKMYFLSLENWKDTLKTVDLETGAITTIGVMKQMYIGFAIDNDGNAYAINIDADKSSNLYSVNLTDATTTKIGPTGYKSNFAQSAAFDRDNGILYWARTISAADCGVLCTVNTQTGAATELGNPRGEQQELCSLFIIPSVKLNTVGVTVAEPATGNAAENAVAAQDGITVESTEWSPAAVKFSQSTEYTVTVKVKATAGYKFDENAVYSINGVTVTPSAHDETSATLTYTFPETEAYTPTFTWSEDYSACSLNLSCSTDTQTVPCTITSETTPSTCTEKGKTVYTAACTFEGTVYTDKAEQTLRLSAHVPSNWVVDKAATETTAGSRHIYCTVCGKTLQTEEIPMVECWAKNYRDVDLSKWYHPAIDYIVSNQLMNGTSQNTFAPDELLTRAMAATVLYHMAGAPKVQTTSAFTDIRSGEWYVEAVNWAAGMEFVKGYSDNSFRPDDSITRQDMICILYRYAKAQNLNMSGTEGTDLRKFKDYDKISEYALEAMKWAVGSGLLQGTSEGILSPRGTATRAQFAQIIMRYFELK